MACAIGNPPRKLSAWLNPLQPCLLLAVLLCAACTPEADAEKGIRQDISAFYKQHAATPPSGVLSLAELVSYRPLISIALFEKLKDASLIEETHFAKHGDQLASLFEGDLFSARQEGFSAGRVLDCIVEEDHAYCNIEINAGEAASVLKWKERIFLTKDKHGWVVDDIDFGRNNPPLRQGRLTALLQAGIERGRVENAN